MNGSETRFTQTMLPTSVVAALLLTTLSSCASNESEKVEALLRVRATAVTDNPREYDVYRQTQVALVTSPFVLTAALRNPQIAELPILKDQKDPVEWLISNVRAEFKEETEVLRVNSPKVPDDQGAQIINAIVNAYCEEVVDSERRDKFVKLELLRDTQQTNRNRMLELHEEIHQLGNELGTDSSRNVHRMIQISEVKAIHQRVVSLEDKLLDAEAERRLSAVAADGSTENEQPAQKKVEVYQTLLDEQKEKLAVAIRQANEDSGFSKSLILKKHELGTLEQVSAKLAQEISLSERSLQQPSSVQLLQLAHD